MSIYASGYGFCDKCDVSYINATAEGNYHFLHDELLKIIKSIIREELKEFEEHEVHRIKECRDQWKIQAESLAVKIAELERIGDINERS